MTNVLKRTRHPFLGRFIAPRLLGDVERAEIVHEAPHCSAWLDRLTARPAVAKVPEERIEAMATVPSAKWFTKPLQRGRRTCPCS